MNLKRMLSVIVLFAVFQVFTTQLGAEISWKFQKTNKGIKAYTRHVSKHNLKEFKGIMFVSGVRLSSLVAAFYDTASYTRWMKNCIKSSLLKKINSYERISYTVIRTPWPTTDRDTVVYSKVSQDPKTRIVTIAIKGLPNYIPKKKKLVRVAMMKATWKFEPLKSGVIKVTYRTVTDPGGWLPNGIASLSIVDMPMSTMNSLRNILKKGRYASANVNIIKELKAN
ncbi:START domain-containing protein [Spirochaetota bacterium]